MIEQINHNMIYDYHKNLMEFGCRYTGSTNASKASQYLYETFQSIGLPTKKIAWKMNGFKCSNVEATIHGTNTNNVTYIICAHYDCSPGSIGADDDGSGVAAILTLANIMANYTFYHTIKFIAFSGEEVGTYGSYVYARDAYRNGADIKAVLNLDMIGYSNTKEGGEKLRFHCPKRSEWIATKSNEISFQYQSILNITVEKRPNYIGADHQAFVDYGYDGVWIAHPDGYPYAHTPNDQPDKLNWTYQLKATKLLCAILGAMANEPLVLHIQLLRPHEGTLYLKDNRIPRLDLGRLWAKELRGITIIFGQATAEAVVIAENEIEYVVFCLNNNFMNFDKGPPYTWSIQGRHAPPIGRYILRVYVFDSVGNVACDEMDILSFSTHYYYRPW
jgi:hypothetical protein